MGKAHIPSVLSKDLPGKLPEVQIPDNVDGEAIASECLAYLQDLQESHLTPDAFWKDILTFTGTSRTIHTSREIIEAWDKLSPAQSPHGYKIVPGVSHVMRLGPKNAFIISNFTFETEGDHAAKCSGSLMLVPSASGSSEWKIWVLSTRIEELKRFGNPDRIQDAPSIPAPEIGNGKVPTLDCVVVGAGQNGLALAGYLQAMGLSYVAIDKNANAGDNWLNRYDSVKLHLNNSYSEMPFGRVFTEDPYFLSKEHLARGMQKYVKLHNIKLLMSTSVKHASWDGDNRLWTITVLTKGEVATLKARHVVFATGSGLGRPNIPQYANKEIFQGKAIHSSAYTNAQDFKGKAGVVIGSGNTAHDVVEDMVDAGLSSVTMVQRGVTMVVHKDTVSAALDPLYNPTMPLEIADRITMANPYPVGRLLTIASAAAYNAQHLGRFDKLRAAGFKLRESDDLNSTALERLGGHHLDVGAAELIADGKVKLKTDSLPVAYTSTGLKFADGTEIEADLVVFGTGFMNSLRGDTAQIVGSDIAEQLDDFWGLDPEGEMRGQMKPIGHPAIWYAGGGTADARFRARFLALQIKADVEGKPFVPFTANFEGIADQNTLECAVVN